MALSGPYSEISARLHRPGQTSLDLTSAVAALRWSTSAIGGFGSASLDLVGLRRFDIPHLSELVIERQGNSLFEGQVDDPGYRQVSDRVTLGLEAFGGRKRLDDASIRRIWTRRDWDWQPIVLAAGTDLGATPLAKRNDLYEVHLGNFDPTNLALAGVEVRGALNLGTANDGDTHQAQIIAPAGLTLTRFMCDLDLNGSNHSAIVQSSADGTTWTTHVAPVVDGTIDTGLVTDAVFVRIGLAATGTQAITTTIYARFTNIRVLGTSIPEDAAGGFYIHTILSDILDEVPGLYAGTIERDTEFVVEQIERSVRSSDLSVVEEVTAYSVREWAIWEGGRFDWVSPNYDDADWILTVADARDVNLRTSADRLARVVYLSFIDATDGRAREVTATATDQRNPYVRLAQTKDMIVSGNGRMTATAAQELVDRYVEESGRFPPTSGSITLAGDRVIGRANGSAQPAYMIRGGDNVIVADLPKAMPLASGRDSQTLFRVAGTEASSETGTVRLELENQTRSLEVILARLAASVASR